MKPKQIRGPDNNKLFQTTTKFTSNKIIIYLIKQSTEQKKLTMLPSKLILKASLTSLRMNNYLG